jgi:2-keto-4-pentenoate hydratase
MQERLRAEAAQALSDAYDSRRPLAPLIQTYSDLTIDDSYAIQLAQVAAWKDSGRIVRGHKVGLTSAAMQRQLQVEQPDYGHLFADMFYVDGQSIPAGAFIQPKVEPEIAFVLRSPLKGPGVTVADAISAVDYVVASLEIIDSRIADWKIGLLDTIADNASSGGVVLGSRPRKLEDIDLRLLGVVLNVNGEVAATGAGAAVLGSPINALVWLANTVGPLGVELRPGDVVLPGAVTGAIAVTPGDTVTAAFSGLGTVTATFASDNTTIG